MTDIQTDNLPDAAVDGIKSGGETASIEVNVNRNIEEQVQVPSLEDPKPNFEPAHPKQESLRKRTLDTTAGTDVVEEFQCSVCFHLAVQPTTLSCGHTTCRLCLAQWYFSSKKKECPLCREAYQGHPKINTQLRNLLIRLSPEEMKRREKEMTEYRDGMKIIAKFDKALKDETTKRNAKVDSVLFFWGIAVTLCSVVVVYLTWHWQYSDDDLLIKKPVATWRPKDVEKWLNEIPWAQHYADTASQQNIDGKYLLSLDEEGVKDLFNVTNRLQLKALVFSLDNLKEQGLKMPVTLWDYKAIYPGRSLFILFGMRHFPRTAVLYMWLYFYDDMFVPFIQATMNRDDEVFNALDPSVRDMVWNPGPTTTMLSAFIFYIIFVPQYPVIIFAWQMFHHHTFTPIFIMASAFVSIGSDLLQWKELFIDRNWRSLLPFFRKYTQYILTSIVFMVMWPLIPRFAVDVIFYGTLYVSPVHLSMELRQFQRHR